MYGHERIGVDPFYVIILTRSLDDRFDCFVLYIVVYLRFRGCFIAIAPNPANRHRRRTAVRRPTDRTGASRLVRTDWSRRLLAARCDYEYNVYLK